MCRQKVVVEILCLLCFLSCSASTAANWLYSHVYGVTDKAPIATALGDDTQGILALRGLIDYYQNLEIDMEKSAESSLDSSPLKFPILPLLIAHLGWPKLGEETQRIYLPYMSGNGNVHRFKQTEKAVFHDIHKFATAVDKAGPYLRSLTTLKFRKYYGLGILSHRTDFHFCTMRTNIAYRINGNWFVSAALTTDRPTISKAEKQRHYIGEFLNFDDFGNVKPVPMFINLTFSNSTTKYWSGSPIEDNGKRKEVTTNIAIWGGKPGVYQFKDGNFEDNIAYKDALINSRDLIRQSQDSRTASNTAILMLPIIMAALPLALFADVEYLITLAYTILTDVLTVLPLGIKGIELIVAGTKNYFATRTATYGNVAREGTAVAETWSVKCRSAQNITVHGIAFLSIALISMAVGIVLEFWARRKVQRLKAAPVGYLEYYWTRGLPCIECRCGYTYREDRSRAFGNGLLGRLEIRNLRNSRQSRQRREER